MTLLSLLSNYLLRYVDALPGISDNDVAIRGVNVDIEFVISKYGGHTFPRIYETV